MLNSSLKSEKLFIELIQIAIGSRDVLSFSPKEEEWNIIVELSKKHTSIGVVLYALEKLSQSKFNPMPNKRIILELYSYNESIKKGNVEQIKNIVKLKELFEKEGFDSCILKGQSIGLLYPVGMQRMPGDIDVWIMDKNINTSESLSKRRNRILEFCKKYIGKRRVFYHHTDFPINNLDIEIHFTPSWMFTPWYNAKLQKFYEEEWHRRRMGAHFFYPSPEMDIIHILLHIYRHLFDEGIGLRQVIDYYFVLKNGVGDKERVIRIMKSIGLYRFAGAMMWILHEVLNMSEEYMLCPADEPRGRQLLDEIMQAGNFGKYDERLSSLNRKSLFSRLKQNINRNIRLMRYYPSESICSPFWKIWQKLWQLYNGYGAKPL